MSLIITGMILLAGCDEHQKDINQAQLRWEQNSAAVNLKIVDNLIEQGRFDEAQKTIDKYGKSHAIVADLETVFFDFLSTFFFQMNSFLLSKTSIP